MACVDKNPSLSELFAVLFSLFSDLTPNQLKGWDVLRGLYNASSDKYSFRKLFERIGELALKTDEPIKSAVYLTQAFKVALDLFPKLDVLMTPMAKKTLAQMLLHGGPTDKFSATLGVFHCIKTILDDLARFGLEGKNFAILVELKDMGGTRFVDVVFYELNPGQMANQVRQINPNQVLRSVEVKWYMAASDIESQYLQLLIDAERSVRNGRRMEDITWMVPKDYPQSKIDELVSMVDAYLEYFLRESIDEFTDAEIATIADEVALNLFQNVFQRSDSLRFFIDGLID